MKIGCLLSAREKATRLKGKSLLPVGGQPLTLFLLNRLSLVKNVDQIVLSTSIHEDDLCLVNLASKNGFSSFQGNEDDKLQRYYDTAIEFGFDAIIVVDGDDPFCFPEFIDRVVLELKKMDSDFVYVSGLPLGAASTGLSLKGLKAVLEAKDSKKTEVWGDYFHRHFAIKKKEIMVKDPFFNHPSIRLTVDYQEDYDLVVEIMKALRNDCTFSSEELMNLLLNKRPKLKELNQVAQKKYLKHLKKSTVIKFKEFR